MSWHSTGVSGELRARCAPIWARILEHPFVRGLGAGTLSRSRYRAWLAQDYGYLVDYARVMALGAASARDLEGLRFYADQLELTLSTEMELHRRTAASFGLSEGDLLATEPHEVPRAYARHLLGVGRAGVEADLVAALLPCAAGYVEIATALRDRGLPAVPAYREWIETYTSEGMVDLASWLVRRLDGFADHATDADRARWQELYRTSSEHELRFFQMAWELGGAS